MALTWKKHPYLSNLIPSDEEIAQMEPSELLEIHAAYHEAIKNAQENPLESGIELEPWKDADKLLEEYDEVLVLGGNRSSKTRYGARTVNKAAMSNPDAEIACFAQDEKASIKTQQRAIHEWLPMKFKKNQKSDTHYIKYSLKNGFTGNDLILPETNSLISFNYYTQFLQNPGKFEGIELGSMEPNYPNIGGWFDEYLLGPDLVNTFRFRLATRDAKLLVTFTTIFGMTEFVAGYLRGAETLETRYVDRFDCIHEHLPYIQRCKTRNAAIIYFHSDMNPFGGWERLYRDLKGRPREEILTRFYGLPQKMMTGQFPNFRRNVNVMRHVDMMNIVRSNSMVTRYMAIDPAEAKRWFMIWVAVDQDGVWYVYREWPDKTYGDWAEMGAHNKSRLSEASKVDGRGVRDYVELIEAEENGEVIYERLIDPRAGAKPKQIEEGTITTIHQLEDEGLIVLPARGLEERVGSDILRGLMAYNTEKPVDAANRPRFYISDRCENTIDSILNYTASEGPNEAWKDPIDVLRYLAVSEIVHEEQLKTEPRKKGCGGY